MLVTFPDGNAASAPSRAHATRCAEDMQPARSSVSPPVFGDDYRSALLSAVLSVDPDMAARDTVDWMRVLPRAAEVDARVDVGGPTALIKDFDDRVSATQPLVFGFVALIAFIMLLISIRSVFLALKRLMTCCRWPPPTAAWSSSSNGAGWRRWASTDLIAGQHDPAAGAGDDSWPI